MGEVIYGDIINIKTTNRTLVWNFIKGLSQTKIKGLRVGNMSYRINFNAGFFKEVK